MFESCDTNIFVYYFNKDCKEHKNAKKYLDVKVGDSNFVVCELVLLELFSLLQSHRIFSNPLSRKESIAIIQSLRRETNWILIDYPGKFMDKVWSYADRYPTPSRSFLYDARLALTLIHYNVENFATRNVKDFFGFGFKNIFNPID